MEQRIFITGGASGLGRAIAVRFARAGYRVAIGDVNEARLQETLPLLEGATAKEAIHCDVTRDEDFAAAAKLLESRWGGVDVVVNNAGVAASGDIDAISMEDWRWIVEINFLGVVRGCRTFTPLFKRQQRGHFVNIASMAGLLDVPRMSSYNATKAAVVSLSETLQNELAEDHIGVTVVCPSFFQTNLTESLRSTDPLGRDTMAKLLARSKITAADVAEEIFQAVQHNEFYVLPHREGRASWRFKRWLPRGLYTYALRKTMKRIARPGRGAGDEKPR